MSSQSASRLGPWVARLAALGGKKAKRPNRRPPFVPTQEQRETVEKLTALLVSQDSIARDWLHTTKPTLLKYFRAEIQHGRERTMS